MGRLKIVYPVCCGMDVHRDFLIACIAATNAQGVTEYQSRRFSTYTGSLRELRDWLLANDCKDVCMESTGKYWFPVHNILEESCHVVVSHPKFVKAIKGKTLSGLPTCSSMTLFAAASFHLRISGSFEIFVVTGSSFRPT